MEIERGLAPCTSEMEVFHDLNVPINFCYPQYFKFESGEEEKIIKQAVSFHENYCVKETRQYSIHSKYFMDKEKLKPEKIDMSYFGQLENDVLACCEYDDIPENDNFSEDLKDKSDYLEGDIAIISKRLEFLKTKTVDELRKDCSLSEDIMRDILSICDEDNSAHSKTNIEFTDRELYMIEEEASIDKNTKSIELDGSNEEDFDVSLSPTNENIQECDDSHPLGKMTFDGVINSQSYDFPVSVGSELECTEIFKDSENSDSVLRDNNRTKLFPSQNSDFPESIRSELECTEIRTESENSDSVLRNNNGTTLFTYSSTNPFLQDLNITANEESHCSDNIPRLNPNNPFLTYLKPKTDDNSSNSVDCVEKLNVPQQWSTNDDRLSDITSISNYSGSSDSVKTSNDVEKCAILTRTSDEDTTYAPQNYPVNPSPYHMPMPNFTAHQNWTMGFNNPYYTRFPNCNYYPPESRFCPPYLSPMHRTGFGFQNMRPQSSVCPPPGFAPRTNFSYGNSNYNISMNGIDPRIPTRPTELFRPPFPMYNCVSGTTTISNVSVTSENDFYEMYNAQLRLRIQQAATNE